jgi:hypothetical protein
MTQDELKAKVSAGARPRSSDRCSPTAAISTTLADGQSFIAVGQPAQNAAEPLTLVQNWIGALKK